ncbi:MAG: helix-turn-helix domain-containing protein [Bifidobacteriaceae bacterium]|jgi:excisionase family DNA binding protein|nr:helix-turn-helix domain-containing protein [Bifidobacteriaceae bacterium]
MMGDIATLVPEPSDTELAASALRGLDAALGAVGPVLLRLSGEAAEVEVPRSALAALAQVLASFAHGEGVTVVPARAELTTQQAADALRVSRPFLIGLLDAGQIEYRTVGTHRRVRAASLIRYLRRDDARRQAAADELAAEARELGFT